MSSFLLVLGLAMWFLGELWIVALAWQDGIMWGVVCLILPIGQFFYIALHWKESKWAWLLQTAGLMILILSNFAK